MRAVRRPRLLTVGAAIVVLALTSALAACEPKPDTYVALGDSYVAGPLIPNQSLSPLGCLRSDHNYPHLVSPGIAVTRFRDPSCSGATTEDMFAAQDVTPGPANPPQLDTLDGRTKVVTVGIGGNDIGFTSIVENCALKNPFGPGCKPDYVHDGRDELRERIAATATDVAAVLQAIEAKAPQAEVFVVGYPTILPASGNGCYPLVPILPSDVPYLRGIAGALNTMLATQAAANGVHYVDTAASSVGHDVCQSVTRKWVEGIIPTSPAAPVHPNAKGMANTAAVVTAAIDAVVS